LGYAYSNEKEVVDYVAKMVPLLCLSVRLDSLLGVLSGWFLTLLSISKFVHISAVLRYATKFGHLNSLHTHNIIIFR
jgi:hypothetical protein